ncbi:MAG: FHA domain-containing protein [Planctomycetales bacterium]
MMTKHQPQVSKSSKSNQQVSLMVLVGGKLGEEIPLSNSDFLIGRSEHADFQINSRQVSRRHCLINIAGDQVTVQDLNSHNGTCVNSQLISGQGVLRHGDTLSLGLRVFRVLINADEAASREINADETECDLRAD